MKNLGLLLLALTIGYFSNAQDCTSYIPMQEGVSMEMTHYDKKDKFSSKSVVEIQQVNRQAGETTATVAVDVYDKKGKVLTGTAYDVKCNSDGYSLDMSAMMTGEQMAGMGDMEMEMEGDWLSIPKNVSVGDRLEDGNITAKASSGAMAIMTMTMNITDREVIAKENVSTPAGDFEALKIRYNYTSKVSIINVRGSAEEWWVKDVGVVKSISYDKKGKVAGRTELTAFNR